ncbi:MAG: hypothetical protein ACYCTE_04900 [Acidimicrobiales bacterium]
MSLSVSSFRQLIEDIQQSADVGQPDSSLHRALWRQISSFVDARVGGGRVRAPRSEFELIRSDLARYAHSTTEFGGTAARIALAVASLDGAAYLVCRKGRSEFLEVLEHHKRRGLREIVEMDPTPERRVSDSISDPEGKLPRHIIIELFDDGETGKHPSSALGRISVEPEEAVEYDNGSLEIALKSAIRLADSGAVVVVLSSLDAAAMEQSIGLLRREHKHLCFYIEIGEALNAVREEREVAADIYRLRSLGAGVMVGMSEPAWRSLVGDPEPSVLIEEFASWNCSAIVLHREEEVLCVSSERSEAYGRCLKGGVAVASLYAESGRLPHLPDVRQRHRQLRATTDHVARPGGGAQGITVSRVMVPVCSSPKRTVGLGDAFTAGFLMEMGGEDRARSV